LHGCFPVALADQLEVPEHASVVLAVDPDQVPENNNQDAYISEKDTPVCKNVTVVDKEAVQPSFGGRALSNLVEQI
jgi:hypothetical protein